MKHTPSKTHRSLKKNRENSLPGKVLSYTRTLLSNGREGTVGLVELENGKRVLAAYLSHMPFIGENVRPRLRLSHITREGLRVYQTAYEATVVVKAPQKFPGYVLALTGPSGVGKSTISKMLASVCADYSEKVPILTTRQPKSGDDGEYVYATSKEFERLKNTRALAAYTQIPSSGEDRRYGYRAEDIEKIWLEGKIPVVVTEMHLLQSLAKSYGRRSILSFGLLPPGKSRRAKLSQLLYRLRARGRETEEQVRERLKNAEEDFEFFDKRKDLFDHIVVNDDLATLVAVLRKKVLVLAKA